MVKVIASSLRKGNVVDIDGRLYAILVVENVHPGKGTPGKQGAPGCVVVYWDKE